jgi:hypothetical protein
MHLAERTLGEQDIHPLDDNLTRIDLVKAGFDGSHRRHARKFGHGKTGACRVALNLKGPFRALQ